MQDLAIAARVCHLWRDVAVSPILWEQLVQREHETAACTELASDGTACIRLPKELLQPDSDHCSSAKQQLQRWRSLRSLPPTVGPLAVAEPVMATSAVFEPASGRVVLLNTSSQTLTFVRDPHAAAPWGPAAGQAMQTTVSVGVPLKAGEDTDRASQASGAQARRSCGRAACAPACAHLLAWASQQGHTARP
jgi:hypothetical protein